MQRLIRQLWRDTGITVLFVTHNTQEALYLSSRVIVLAKEAPDQGSRIALELLVPELCPELNSLAFPRQLESLCHRHISVKKRSQPDGCALPCMSWKLVRKGVRGARIRKDAGIPVLIDAPPGL